MGLCIYKLPELMEHLLDRQPDVAFITETWLKSEKNSITAEIKSNGYELVHKIRKDRDKNCGGGVGILIKSAITHKPLPSKEFHSFECNIASIPLNNKRTIVLISVYRPQFVPVAEFIKEFSELLEAYAVLTEDVIIAGDVNIHLETEEGSSQKFKDLIDLYDLKHVIGPTHILVTP